MKQISGQTPAMNQAITCRSYSVRCISYAAGKTAATTTLTVSLGRRRFSTHPTEQRQWFISVWGLGLHWGCDPVHPPPEEADHVRRGTVLPASHRRSDHRRSDHPAMADQRTKHVAKVRVMCILVRDRWSVGQNWCPHHKSWHDACKVTVCYCPTPSYSRETPFILVESDSSQVIHDVHASVHVFVGRGRKGSVYRCTTLSSRLRKEEDHALV